MSRVVTSADIDALNRKIQQQGQELSQTNERVARLEAQVRELQTSAATPPQPQSPAETFLSDGGPVTDSAPASDAGVSVTGE